MRFLPTQRWIDEVCRGISGLNKAPPELSIIAVDAPQELGGEITLYFKFEANRCAEARLLHGRHDAQYVLSARYEDLLRIMEGRLSPFAAVPLGKLRVERGDLGQLADYMPLALEIVEVARRVARSQTP